MEVKELVKALKNLQVQTGSLACLGCGHEHGCGMHGCAILRDSANLLESMQEELDRVKAERDAAIRDLESCDIDCNFCVYAGKYKDCDLDCINCGQDCVCSVCRDNNRWQWRGLEGRPLMNDTLKAALDLYGPEAQTLMVFEEMAELQKELCKHARGKDNREEIAEEIADVLIMLDQMMILHDCESLAARFRELKIERLEQRIREMEGRTK